MDENIFICYREKTAILGRLFKKYIEALRNNARGNYKCEAIGRPWYSDSEIEGNYKSDLDDLIGRKASFACVFAYEGFTEGFYTEGDFNDKCITAHEFVHLARRRLIDKNFKIIFVFITKNGFSEQDKSTIKRLFDEKLSSEFTKEDIEEINIFFAYHNHAIFNQRNDDPEHLAQNVNYEIDRYYFEYDPMVNDFDNLSYEIINAAYPQLYKKERVTFGRYPQKRVTDNQILNILNGKIKNLPTEDDSKDWVPYSYMINGKHYMFKKEVSIGEHSYQAVYFTQYRPFMCGSEVAIGHSYQSDNGYFPLEVYWFEIMPIEWFVLPKKDGARMLFSVYALDSQYYHDNYNSTLYVQSYIHNWLNTEFLDAAFTKEEKINIINSLCEDEANVFSKCGKIYILSDFELKQFLLIRREFQKHATDYAACMGAYLPFANIREESFEKRTLTDWFIRSVGSFEKDVPFYNTCGERLEDLCTYANGGIVPGLFMKSS